MSGSAGNTSDWLLSAMKKNPEGLLLLAAGAVLLMRKTGGLGLSNAMSSGLSPNGGFTKAAAGAKEYVAGAKEYAAGAKDYAADVAERAKQTVGSAASSASEYADQARRTVSRQSERVMDQAQSTFQSTMNRVLQDQPLMVALAGMAAGAAVAATFPTTDFEKETLGPLGEQVSDAANRMGEQFKEATAKAGEKLKNVVDEKGLNVGGLKDVASEVAGAFSGSLTGGSGSGTSDKAPQTKLPGEHGYRG